MQDQDKKQPPKGGVDTASFYQSCIAKVDECEQRNDVEGALVWLRQAEFVGAIVLKRDTLAEVNAGYVRLISRTAKKARDLAVTSGNITKQHEQFTSDLRTMSTQLRLRFANDEEKVARAAVLEGLCQDTARQVNHFLQGQQPVYTSALVLDKFLENVNAILLNVSQMGVDLDNTYGTDDELLELARTSASNAQYTLPWFLPARFQDWDKAAFHCKRASQLVAQHLSIEGSAAGTEPELDAIHATLKTAEAALTRRDRKAAQQALESAHDALTSYIANL